MKVSPETQFSLRTGPATVTPINYLQFFLILDRAEIGSLFSNLLARCGVAGALATAGTSVWCSTSLPRSGNDHKHEALPLLKTVGGEGDLFVSARTNCPSR